MAPAAAHERRQHRRRLQLPPSISSSLIPQQHFGITPRLGTSHSSSAVSPALLGQRSRAGGTEAQHKLCVVAFFLLL